MSIFISFVRVGFFTDGQFFNVGSFSGQTLHLHSYKTLEHTKLAKFTFIKKSGCSGKNGGRSRQIEKSGGSGTKTKSVTRSTVAAPGI